MASPTNNEQISGRFQESQGGISLENWIGLWLKHFNLDPKLAFRDLVYVGFCGSMKEAIEPIFARPRHINGIPQSRKTFNCFVVGGSGSGKSTFLNSFISAMAEEVKQDQEDDALLDRLSDQIISRSVVKAVKEKDPKNKDKYNLKYLTLTEINEEAVMSTDDGPGALFHSKNASLLQKCDAIVLLFESNDSE